MIAQAFGVIYYIFYIPTDYANCGVAVSASVNAVALRSRNLLRLAVNLNIVAAFGNDL